MTPEPTGPVRSRPGGAWFQLLGVGAMASPRFAPAGLLVVHGSTRVMLDGGPGATPDPPLHGWLVTDDHSELRAAIRRLAGAHGLEPVMADLAREEVHIAALPVSHTTHPTVGFRIVAADTVTAWAPEFDEFPEWAAGADLMFAEGASWSRPIRFRGGVGGHMAVLDVAAAARAAGVRRLVFAHLGRPTIRALERGLSPPFGEIGVQGGTYRADN